MSRDESSAFQDVLTGLIDTKFKTLFHQNTTKKSMVDMAVDILDADLSEFDPESAGTIGITLLLLVFLGALLCAWSQRCWCCRVCCFANRLVPNNDSKDEIIGDDDFDPEAVHTDPRVEVTEQLGKHMDIDDDMPATSPACTETNSDEDDDGEDGVGESGRGGGGGTQPESAYDKDSRACCDAVANCLERESTATAASK